MKRLLVFAVFLFSLTHMALAEDTSARYYIPPQQFSALLEVMDSGFANMIALFQNATGSFTFDTANKSISNLKLAIDASSLMTNNSKSQRDLATMLGAVQFPEMRITDLDTVTFTDNKADIKANLTLHGVTKPITLQATLNRSGKSPHGGGMWSSGGEAVGLSLHGSFKRGDFGMADSPETPGRFGDTITLTLEVQALKQ